jgi:hypothetical protein
MQNGRSPLFYALFPLKEDADFDEKAERMTVFLLDQFGADLSAVDHVGSLLRSTGCCSNWNRRMKVEESDAYDNFRLFIFIRAVDCSIGFTLHTGGRLQQRLYTSFQKAYNRVEATESLSCNFGQPSLAQTMRDMGQGDTRFMISIVSMHGRDDLIPTAAR